MEFRIFKTQILYHGLDKAQQVNLPAHAAPRNPIQHEAVSSDASSNHNSKLVQDGTSLALKYLEIQQRRLGSTVIPRPPFVLSFSARGSQARWRPVVPGIYTNKYFLHYQTSGIIDGEAAVNLEKIVVNPEDKWRYSFIDYNWNEHRLSEKVELARDHAMKVLKSAVIFIH